MASNVKSTFFQDRKLSFCCFRSKKDRMNWFFQQNYGSERNVFNQFLKKLGLKTVVIMDSAGCLLPSEVKKIFLELKKININLGFHAHNNLGNAIWNTVEAYKAGANILDVSMRGFGAGAGNTQIEILLTVLKKMHQNSFKKFNINEIYKMSENFRNLLDKNENQKL